MNTTYGIRHFGSEVIHRSREALVEDLTRRFRGKLIGVSVRSNGRISSVFVRVESDGRILHVMTGKKLFTSDETVG